MRTIGSIAFAIASSAMTACCQSEDIDSHADTVSASCAGVPMLQGGAGWTSLKTGVAIDLSGSGLPVTVPLLIPSGAIIRGVSVVLVNAEASGAINRPFFSVNNTVAAGQVDTMGTAHDNAPHGGTTRHTFGIRFDGYPRADVTAGSVTAEFYGVSGRAGTTLYGWVCDTE